MTRIVYTDGACSRNPGPGGWAWAVERGPWAAGPAAQTTNQRMEITAAFEAVKTLDGPIEIRSDSTYVVNCFNQGWWEGWLKRGWTNSKKEPVANRDLWEPFIELVRSRGDVTFSWVKGHAGDPMNDAVDKLAVEATATQQARAGDVLDATVLAGLSADMPKAAKAKAKAAASDAPGAGTSARASSRAGDYGAHAVAVTGHRPPELGGWDLPNATADAVRDRLAQIFAAKREVDPDAVVLTGLGLGAEQLAAEAAAAAGVAYVAVLAFPGMDGAWPKASRQRFGDLLRGAREQVEVTRTAPADKAAFAAAMRARDEWLASHAAEAVVVWNRDDPHLGRLVRTWESRLDDVWVVEP